MLGKEKPLTLAVESRSVAVCRDAFRGGNVSERCRFSPSSSPSLPTSPPSRAALHDSGSTFGRCSEYVGLCSLGDTRLVSGITGQTRSFLRDTSGGLGGLMRCFTGKPQKMLLIQHISKCP
ncbi:hypothetical protein PBY51_017264 [Eleginops maclovinus]|uniref:Uncharacterized protein n=1 Tax=Eleginops maclovinus TaxID=56733 RepID=A0AAN8ANX3_ELEMC|nr:hypothetical protein PBY51_017264 [Eleginops maclovinus]